MARLSGIENGEDIERKTSVPMQAHDGRLHQRSPWFSKVVLGLLVAATGVGAGDLITASLAGSAVGLAILWAAAAGALLKWVLNEGIARWQMGTSSTLLEGWVRHLGGLVHWVFFIYFIGWSYIVGGALINACGVAGVGLLPVGDPHTSKIVWGIIHSLVGLALAWAGGFKAFEYVMSFLTAVMVVSVLLTVVLISPDWGAVARGLIVPAIPKGSSGWLLGVMGGVGGTVTLLCYSYWIREAGRSGKGGLRESRFDLAIAYILTAFFGVSMVIVGSRIKVEGRGDTVALALASELGRVLGPPGKYIFLLGFWGAVFTSLLGVWQGVPYLFADFLSLRRKKISGGGLATDPKKTPEYRAYLLALTFLPLTLLWFKVQQVQLIYGIVGAFFMPFVALTLLVLNNRGRLVAREFRNSWAVNLLLAVTLAFFSYVGFREILDLLLR
jgi:Mn2+/Fe2+ NRAMP family transporter